jgi:hypothetical protein
MVLQLPLGLPILNFNAIPCIFPADQGNLFWRLIRCDLAPGTPQRIDLVYRRAARQAARRQHAINDGTAEAPQAGR